MNSGLFLLWMSKDSENCCWGQKSTPRRNICEAFKQLKLDAEAYLGKSNKTVITVPAYFTDGRDRRPSTRENGWLMFSPFLLSHAAALAYKLQHTLKAGREMS
ncbi:Chaperone protein DnaK [Orchesella cincta]|uniref:Chaperone protein DnaK n=1 Tax=Orchesella cincta TaxID=48709 RepID=A0A1D2M1M7_ORCCI|nr:Chaperone protein DnaK [Orchesella cincta]